MQDPAFAPAVFLMLVYLSFIVMASFWASA